MSEKLESMRHTLSHVMAAAVKEMYPEAKFGIGPAINDGFYYDIDFGSAKIVEADLAKIEKRMRKIIQAGFSMERSEKSREEALKWADENKQDLKRELTQELSEGETISFYTITSMAGKPLFEDLCKGPHVVDSKEISPAFKLNRVAGAYWRGDEKRQMLTRLYGVAFEKEDELEEYLKKQEEAKARDHRKLGQQLDLFCNSPLVGSGLPLFTPRGTVLRDKLNDFTQSYRLKAGYKKVCIPHIANVDLYKTSGHYEKFPEMLQFVSQESGDHLAIKPVSCPHHSQIFASVPRSYKELPVKYLETTMVYRDERKGELGGLSRVRAITQDDSHVFCTDEQVGDIFGELIAAAKDLYKRVNMKLKLRLSFRDDGDGYIGTPEMWAKAESQIKEMAEKFKMDYFIGEGEAAMYGPKMDFMAMDALGREWQLATVQLDYAMPARFGLEYVAEDGSKKTPIMIHCALIGSIERFMSVYIEHTAGWFPLWVAPEQVRILTVNDQVSDYVAKITEVLDGMELNDPIAHNEMRYTVDDSSDSLGKKIRRATDMKVPCVLIVGPKDAEEGQVSVRIHDEKAEGGSREEKVKLEKLEEYIRSL
ncbi:threonine--tRNA ligase [Candidatus Saccharibacteria bacterium]|nr:threonine--tRNA ligase [Candidatus Saccharibacteria bacterium]